MCPPGAESGETATQHGYFETIGIPLLRGRGFISADNEDAPLVMVINEFMARSYWGQQDPVGQRSASLAMYTMKAWTLNRDPKCMCLLHRLPTTRLEQQS